MAMTTTTGKPVTDEAFHNVYKAGAQPTDPPAPSAMKEPFVV